MRHPEIKNQKVVDKVISRRGTLHAFNNINPLRTALVTIDMTASFVEADSRCLEMIPSINSLASTLRNAGGTVAWVTVSSKEVQQNHIAVFGQELATVFYERAQSSSPDSKLHEKLVVKADDVVASKEGFSAFFPGRSNLHEQLKARNIETILICGTVTNICCESSARDAVELGYQVIFLSDLNAGHGHGLHEASLTTFYRAFGDVRPFSEMREIIKNHSHNKSSQQDAQNTRASA
ncbi:MAG: cysteine hydrolase family protein [Arenicella sp.]